MKVLTIKRRQLGVNIQEVYFQANACPDTPCDLRVDFCTEAPSRHSNRTLTSLIDLRHSADTILQGFDARYRTDIESSSNQAELHFQFSTDPRPLELQQFADAYYSNPTNTLAQQQLFNKLLFFVGHGSLILSSVHCQKSAKLLCQHALIGDGQRARLFCAFSAASAHRFDKPERKRIARAHRALHWHDMCQFKQRDYQWYDLGGLSVEEDTFQAKINRFKQGFGGELRYEYINFLPKTLKGWLAMRYLMRTSLIP